MGEGFGGTDPVNALPEERAAVGVGGAVAALPGGVADSPGVPARCDLLVVSGIVM